MKTLIQGNAQTFPIVESVRERDIDLLILEELYAHTGFEQIFLDLLGKNTYKFNTAHRSISVAGLGETDIQIECIDPDNKKIYILLENKIDAMFQDAQYERYQKRGELLKNDNAESFVILVAPKNYIDQKSEFEYSISYEQLIVWFKNKSDGRSWYKQEILRLAIDQERRGYQIVRDDTVTNFWKAYYSYIQANLLELNMPEPKAKPTLSSFAYFHPDWLPKNTKLIHKMEKGCLDFELSGKADDHDQIIETYSKLLDPTIDIVVTGKSISFRKELTPLTFKEPLDEQLDVMKSFVAGYDELKKWVKNNYK